MSTAVTHASAPIRSMDISGGSIGVGSSLGYMALSQGRERGAEPRQRAGASRDGALAPAIDRALDDEGGHLVGGGHRVGEHDVRNIVELVEEKAGLDRTGETTAMWIGLPASSSRSAKLNARRPCLEAE